MNLYRLLILDDDTTDAEIVEHELKKSSFPLKVFHVTNRSDFEQQLNEFKPDIILSDCRMPAFDGLSALRLAKEKQPATPFIFVSGTMGEELAIETLKQGATDYVLKGRLSRLRPAVERALTDVEERKRREECEEKSRETQSRLKLVLEQLPCILWTVDDVLTFTSCVGRALQALELKPHELVGLSLMQCAKAHDSEWMPVLAHRRALKGEFVQYHFNYRGRTFNCHVEPLYNSQRQITGAVGVGLDITEFKHLEERLFDAKKMAALSHLSADIARDFNELMKIQLVCCDAMLASVTQTDPLRKELKQIRGISEKALKMVNQLALYGHGQIFRAKPLELNEHLSQSLEIFRRLMGEEVEIVLRTSPVPSSVFIDPEYFDYALMNIATNAHESMSDGRGKFTLEVSTTDVVDEITALREGVPKGAYVVLKISDTGAGMSPSTLEHAFDPFFTTKSPESRGLGLSAVYGIIRRSGGFIRLQSQCDQGTCLTLYLPRLPATSLDTRRKRTFKSPVTTVPKTILLVQKERYLQLSLKAFLTGMGYRILEAESADHAIALMQENSGNIQLVFCDWSIAQTRVDFVPELEKHWPGVKILLTTDMDVVDRPSTPGNSLTPFKPYNLTMLAEKIRNVLSS